MRKQRKQQGRERREDTEALKLHFDTNLFLPKTSCQVQKILLGLCTLSYCTPGFTVMVKAL